jgi:hypothetical protein
MLMTMVMIIARVLTVLLILWLSLALLYGPSDADALSSSAAATYLPYIVGLLVLVVLISAIPTLRGIRSLALVMALAVTGYAYRFEIQRVGEHVLGRSCPTVARRSATAAYVSKPGRTGSFASMPW